MLGAARVQRHRWRSVAADGHQQQARRQRFVLPLVIAQTRAYPLAPLALAHSLRHGRFLAVDDDDVGDRHALAAVGELLLAGDLRLARHVGAASRSSRRPRCRLRRGPPRRSPWRPADLLLAVELLEQFVGEVGADRKRERNNIAGDAGAAQQIAADRVRACRRTAIASPSFQPCRRIAAGFWAPAPARKPRIATGATASSPDNNQGTQH